MTLSAGDTLLNGQYRILRQIGRGGFGVVYHALDTLIHSDVAIKELIPGLVGDEATLKRFLTEARATMKLRHDRIVGTHNLFQQDGNYYFVMEYMSGGSLEDLLLAQGGLEPGQATQIAAQVCQALTYAHERGIVHCDLKPANILFDAKGAAKLADFGIAHVSDQMHTRTWNTPAGFTAGTLPYMSPEQTDGRRDDPRIDVYSLGAVLYRALTSRPYVDFDQRHTPRANAQNILLILNDVPAPPSAYKPGIPVWLDDVVLKALAKEPNDRYASAAALRSALLGPPTRVRPAAMIPGAVASGPTRPGGAPPQQAPAPPPASRTSPQRWLWLAGAAAALLLVAIIIALVLEGSAGSRRAAAPGATLSPFVVAASDTNLTSTPTVTAPAADTPPPAPTTTPVPTTAPATTPLPANSPTATPLPTNTPTTTPSPTITLTPVHTTVPQPSETPRRAPTTAATARPEPTKSKPTATKSPAPAGDKFAAPAPQAPADGQAFTVGDEIVLRWQPVGQLAADEYYQITVTFTPATNPAETWTDEVPWTKNTQWALSEHNYLPELSANDLFRWSVQVMLKTGQNADGKPTGRPLSPASAESTLTWKPSAGGAGEQPTAAPP